MRVSGHSPHGIRHALDSGATGILVPHVTTAEEAKAIVAAAHFGEGGRGYAGSPRAANYTGKGMATYLKESREQTTVIVQIEDIAALDNVDDIARSGVDALFVGRNDLAVAMGVSPADENVISAVRRICTEARDAGIAVGMFTGDLAELPAWIETGSTFFLLSSEQSMVIASANALAEQVRGLAG